MAKDLKEMTRQEVHSYFKFKDYRGEQLKVVMAALDYGVDVSYLRLFDDTGIPAEIMANMFTAMKEDYGVEAAAFLSTVSQPENGCIFLEALKSGVPLHELKGVWAEGMLPIELREKILPLHAGQGSHTGEGRGKDGVHFRSGKGVERKLLKAGQLP